jgi:hypothetical protein
MPAGKPPGRKRSAPGGRPPGIDRGDHVYVQHPDRGPIAVKVLACGADGLTGECDKSERHQVTWDRVLGHKKRLLHTYKVADQGADGAILEAPDGRRRYLEGALLSPEVQEPAAAAGLQDAPEDDDPILGGMSRLKKAITMKPTLILLKAAVANRPGLALKDVTDKAGHRTKRWTKTQKDQPAAPHGAPLEHGQTVAFRHGDVGHQGKIVGSGADGVTVEDKDGEQHQVRHEHLVTPGAAGAPAGGKAAEPGATTDAEPKAAPGSPDTADGPAKEPELFSPDEVKDLPVAAKQPFNDESKLFAEAEPALGHLREWLNMGKGICDQLGFQTMKVSPDDVDWKEAEGKGGMLFIAKVKGKARASEKVRDDYAGDWSKLCDPVRCSIAVDKMDDLSGVIDALKKGGMKLARQPKDRFRKPTNVGYRDLMLNVVFPNGLVGEVQVHLKAMLQAKNDGHHHYEIARPLESKAEKGKPPLTPEEESTLRAANEAQSEIYGKAWQAVAGGQPAETSMAKAIGMAGYDFLEHDDAHFRRRKGKLGMSVDDVLVGDKWQPYLGDRYSRGLFGSPCEDPTAAAGSGEAPGGDTPMAKSILLLLPKRK